MRSVRHGSAVIDFPNELEIVITRDFDAPIALVFDVLTKPEHVRHWGATPPDKMLECSIDLRVGGNYRSSFLTGDGQVFTIRGTYLEVEPPTRTRQTWLFEMWPDVDAVETFELHETGGVTTFRWSLAFQDKAGRDHMTGFDQDEITGAGQLDSLDAMEDILNSLLNPRDTATQ
ncbi:MAG TPA: SRPBCC domain-containing protein [Nocardioidaceae bacterium]